MRKPRAVMVYKGWAAFLVPSGSALVASAGAFDNPSLTTKGVIIIVASCVVAGISGLNSYFDKTYGESTEPLALAEAPLNLPPKVDPTAEILKALVAKGYSEGLARSTVAYDLEEAARIAKGGE